MRRFLTTCALAAVFSALALAETYTGTLLDATCAADQAKMSAGACGATSTTTAFALQASGKIYKLDDAGNQKAQEALKGRADRAKDPDSSMSESNRTVAKITGTQEGEILKVEALEVQ